MCGGGALEKGPSDFKEHVGIVPSAVVRMRKSLFLSELVIAPQSVFGYWSTILSLCTKHTAPLVLFEAWELLSFSRISKNFSTPVARMTQRLFSCYKWWNNCENSSNMTVSALLKPSKLLNVHINLREQWLQPERTWWKLIKHARLSSRWLIWPVLAVGTLCS